MESPRVPAFLPLLVLASLLVAVAGCGSDAEERYESESTRAIREKVRAELADERLERLGKRFAEMNEGLAASPNAFQLTEGEASDQEVVPASLEEGETLYAANCASCHGAAGGGDGPLGAALNPPPTKHNDGAYMNALSNDHLYKVVDLGGAAVGKSALMAPWGTSLSENQIIGLVGFMRTLAAPAYDGAMPEGL